MCQYAYKYVEILNIDVHGSILDVLIMISLNIYGTNNIRSNNMWLR